jgi:hypothetical protein
MLLHFVLMPRKSIHMLIIIWILNWRFLKNRSRKELVYLIFSYSDGIIKNPSQSVNFVSDFTTPHCNWFKNLINLFFLLSNTNLYCCSLFPFLHIFSMKIQKSLNGHMKTKVYTSRPNNPSLFYLPSAAFNTSCIYTLWVIYKILPL